MNIKTLAIVSGLALATLSSSQMVDFEDLNNNGTSGFTLWGDNVNSGGFNFASTTHVGGPDAIASWTIDLPSFYTGSVALFGNYTDEVVNMTKIGGGAFSVSSIDMADVFLGGTTQTVNFVGTLADASTVTESVVLSTSSVLTTYALSNMNNVVSMTMEDSTSSWFQFDNVNVVPEPASMIALGAGLLAVARRRRKA